MADDVLKQLYDFLQAPYNARQAAGQVVTPGFVDTGAIYNALQAPYEARQGREAVASAPGFTGSALPKIVPRSPSDPTGLGGDWGTLTGMLDDPVYSSQPYTPANSSYGQPPTSVAQTRSEQANRPSAGSAVAAIDDAFSIPHANGTLDAGKSQVKQLPTTFLSFNGDPAAGIPAGGGMGGAAGAAGKVSLASLLGGVGMGGRALPNTILGGNPGQTDWNVANNGMQGINGPNDAKYLANDPRNAKPGVRPTLPKYAVNNAPGTFNRDTGTWNTGMPASGNGLPNIMAGAGNALGGLGSLLKGGFDHTLIGHLINAISGGGTPQTPIQAGAQMAGGALPHPVSPMVNLNTVSPDSPAAGLLAKNGGGLGEGAQVSFRPGTEQRWLTGY